MLQAVFQFGRRTYDLLYELSARGGGFPSWPEALWRRSALQVGLVGHCRQTQCLLGALLELYVVQDVGMSTSMLTHLTTVALLTSRERQPQLA
jgi:hypothetical protein